MKIPLKPADPLVGQLIRVGLAGAAWATFVYFIGPWFPEVVQPYNWWLYDTGLAVAVVCCGAVLVLGAFKDRGGGPPTA